MTPPQSTQDPCREALAELVAAVKDPFPTLERGSKAQDAWAERRASALASAERALAQELAGRAPEQAEYPINFRLALNVSHPECHKAADALWAYWKANGETHKRGYYESTWGAINRAIRLVGVRPWDYGLAPQEPATSTEQEPVGWRLVPVEPTDDMLFAAEISKPRGYADLYRAMLAAAPQPPAASPPEPAQQYHDWQSIVFTLMGHAAGLYSEGKRDMPAWFYELAEKIAREHVDESHAKRAREVGVQMRAKYAGPLGDSVGADGKRPAAAGEGSGIPASGTLAPVLTNRHGSFQAGTEVRFDVENPSQWIGPTSGMLVFEGGEFAIKTTKGIVTINRGYDAYLNSIRASGGGGQ